MKTQKMTIVFALCSILALAFIGCGDGSGGNGDGNDGNGGDNTKTFTSVSELETYLENFTGENSVTKPIKIKINVSDPTELSSAISKYVSLDLSDSTFTSIDDVSFGWGSLIEIILPASITTMNKPPFQNHQNLTSITIAEASTILSSADGVLYDKAKTTLIRYPEGKTGTVTIPNTVTDIADNAFYNCKKISSISLPDGIIHIGVLAFYNCPFTSITIPATVSLVDWHAFTWCQELTSVTFLGESVSYSEEQKEGFPGYLEQAYEEGKAGTYTRPSKDSDDWTKQP